MEKEVTAGQLNLTNWSTPSLTVVFSQGTMVVPSGQTPFQDLSLKYIIKDLQNVL